MKKIISTLLALTMVFSILPVGAATVTSSDDGLSAEETGIMTKLGILSNDDLFSYNKNFEITRAGFVQIADRIVKAEGMGTGSAPFWDVEKTNEYYNDIDAAYSFGLIDGGVGDDFRPYDIITYNEAVKIASVMLGYKAYANLNGGYPLGFVSVAKNAGFDLTGVGGNQKLTYTQAVRILFKVLTAKTLEQSSYGDTISYTNDKDNTLLKQNFDVEVVTGVLNATDITNIVANGAYSENELMVGGEMYRCDDAAPYRSMLGYRVNCYYTSSSDLHDIVYIAKYRTKTLLIDADEIGEVSENSVVYYDEAKSDKKNTVNINEHASYVYNGKALDYATEYSDDMIADLDLGEVLFIDNDNDGTYDVISITEYVNYIVESVNKNDNIVYGKYNKGDNLELTDDIKWQISDMRGNSYTLNDLSKGISLMAARTMDRSYINIIYCDDTVEGKVSGINKDNEVKINGKDYKISREYLENGNDIIVGTEGVFYLNAHGQIVELEYSVGGGAVFGYLMKVKRESTLSENVGVSVMANDEDKTLTFNLAKTVNIDGNSYKGADKIIKTLNPNGKTAVAEVIRYWLNDDGEIYKIDTPVLGSRETEDNSLVQRWTRSDSALGWKKSGRLGSKFYISLDNGTIYGIDDYVESSNNVTVYTPTSIGDDTNCVCDVYSVGTDSVKADIMVMKREDIEGSGGGNQVPTTTSYMCVFESYTHELNEDGETVGVITYYDGQAKVSAYVEESDEVNIPDLFKLNPGDGFYIKTDKKNYLKTHISQDKGYTNLYRVYDYENDEFLYDSKYDTGQWRVSSGIVYDIDDVYARVGDKGLDYNNMTYEEKDRDLTTYLIYYSYNGGGVYEVLKDGTLQVSVPSASTVQDYSVAGNNADRLISQREYGHDRRNCYFRH